MLQREAHTSDTVAGKCRVIAYLPATLVRPQLRDNEITFNFHGSCGNYWVVCGFEGGLIVVDNVGFFISNVNTILNGYL